MGAQQSFLLATQLQNHTLSELLEDDEFVRSLEAGAFALSRKSRTNLQNLLASTKKSSKANSRLRTAKLKPLLKLQDEEVTLPLSLQESLEVFKTDWAQFFWGKVGFQALEGHDSLAAALLWAYKYVFAFEKRQAMDRIRWRFFTMFFYDLHCLINENINITSKAVQSVIFAIDPSGAHFDEINAEIRSWIAKGHRYRNISRSLGGPGCLFLLPESISEYLWEESLPLSGPTHVEAMNRLRSLDIVDKCIELGVDELAEAIEEGLLEPFKTGRFSERPRSSERMHYQRKDSQYVEAYQPFDISVPFGTTCATSQGIAVSCDAPMSSTELSSGEWVINQGYFVGHSPPTHHMSGYKPPTTQHASFNGVKDPFWPHDLDPGPG